MEPIISILLGVYNGEKFLRESIESILGQTYTNFEFLIIDDASTDSSSEIVKEYSKIDDRIRYIRLNQNKGLGFVLNHGIKIAKGDYIARMDDDDIAMPERLETQLQEFIQDENLDILGTWAVDVDEFGKERDLRKVPTSHLKIKKYIWTNPVIHPSVMFKKSSIEGVGMYNKDLKKRQDYELWFRCIKKGLKFKNIDKPLIKYRFTQGWFEKNDAKVIWDQVKMGWKGCRLVDANLYAYLGVAFPLIKIFLGGEFGVKALELFKKIDPRVSSI